jgi:hypothetical protein
VINAGNTHPPMSSLTLLHQQKDFSDFSLHGRSRYLLALGQQLQH